MKFEVRLLSIISVLYFATPVFSSPWNLPLTINDQNSVVTFEVDSTWHLIKGQTSGATGKVWLANPDDYTTVDGEITLPVSSFNTDNSLRDKRLKEVMEAERFPFVHFSIDRIEGICEPNIVITEAACDIEIIGDLTIRDVVKKIHSSATIEQLDESNFSVRGEIAANWADFGVEDPSILIAKLNQQVVVIYNITLKKGGR